MTDKIYPGEPWHADESEDCVRIFRGNLQIVKAPKCDTPFEEYWPDPSMLTWMLAAFTHLDKIEILNDNQDRLHGAYQTAFDNWNNPDYIAPVFKIPHSWNDDIAF